MNESIVKILKCPVCGSNMELKNKLLACANRHSYDVSRDGGVNFITYKAAEFYGPELFRSRAAIWAEGVYDALTEALCKRLLAAAFCDAHSAGQKPVLLLDAGCGEGSLLAAIKNRLGKAGVLTEAAGIDLSKAGIKPAAKVYRDISFAVADMNGMPFMPRCFDALINMLSPACYAEFDRVVKPGGLVFKVVPETDYLCEIRELLPGGPEKQPDSAPVKLRFTEHYEQYSERRLTYSAQAPAENRMDLLRMTPMCAHIDGETLTALAEKLGTSITIDLTILEGIVR